MSRLVPSPSAPLPRSPWTNLGDLIDRGSDLDKTALIDLQDQASPRFWTYRDLDRRSAAVAAELRGRGLARGDRVAVLAANSAEYLAAFFGIMRAGLVAVPLNIKLPQPTLDYVLADAAVALVLADADRRASAPPGMAVAALGHVGTSTDGFETVAPLPGELALILYTSGSTGRPKGVPLTHAGQLWAIAYRTRLAADLARHRLLVAAPYYHMNALCVSAFAVAAGASLVLLPRFEARAYLEAIPRFRCTWLTSVPTMLALLARETELLARADLSSVERVATGSAPLTQALVDKVKAIFPGALFTNGYGTTEAGPAIFGPHPGGVRRPDLALGYPIEEVSVRLVDGDDTDAASGVLHVKTPALTPGYLNLPERTAAVMTPDGYCVTGDVMRRDADGFYHFVGRADDVFICNGENVHPSEVETMLERHPAIHEACVVAVPDDVRGQMPVAFVVPRPGARLTPEAVKAWALAHGPAYQHPRHVALVPALPRAGTEKIDRASLTERALTLTGRRSP
jgi:acyl-CoA synthetase (AMP-forming)/AMP-acid ligase II